MSADQQERERLAARLEHDLQRCEDRFGQYVKLSFADCRDLIAALRSTPAEATRDPDGYVHRFDLKADGTVWPGSKIEPENIYGDDAVPFYGCEPVAPPQQEPVAPEIVDAWNNLLVKVARRDLLPVLGEHLNVIAPLIRAPEESSDGE